MWWLVLCGLALTLNGCGTGRATQTYHVTAEQLAQMGQIAGVPPCPQGPTLVTAVKRQGGGGVMVVQCPLRGGR